MIMNLNDTIIIHKSSLFELSKTIQNDPDVQNHTATFRHCPPRGSWRPISLRLRLRMPLEFWKSMPDRTEVPSGSSACPDWNFPFFWRISGDFPGKIIYKWSLMEHCRCPVFWIVWSKLRWQSGESPAGISSPWSDLPMVKTHQTTMASQSTSWSSISSHPAGGLLECVWRHWLLWRCVKKNWVSLKLGNLQVSWFVTIFPMNMAIPRPRLWQHRRGARASTGRLR